MCDGVAEMLMRAVHRCARVRLQHASQKLALRLRMYRARYDVAVQLGLFGKE